VKRSSAGKTPTRALNQNVQNNPPKTRTSSKYPEFAMTSHLNSKLIQLQTAFIQFLDKLTISHFSPLYPQFQTLKTNVQHFEQFLFLKQILELTAQLHQRSSLQTYIFQTDLFLDLITRYNILLGQLGDYHYNIQDKPENRIITPSKLHFELQLLQNDIRNTLQHVKSTIDIPDPKLLQCLEWLDGQTTVPQSMSDSGPNNEFPFEFETFDSLVHSDNHKASFSKLDSKTQNDIINLARENVLHEVPRVLIMATCDKKSVVWFDQFSEYYNSSSDRHRKEIQQAQLCGTLPFPITNPSLDPHNCNSYQNSIDPKLLSVSTSPVDSTASKGLLSTEAKTTLASHPIIEQSVEPNIATIFDIIQASIYRALWKNLPTEPPTLNHFEHLGNALSGSPPKDSQMPVENYPADKVILNFDSNSIALCTTTNFLLSPPDQQSGGDLVENNPFGSENFQNEQMPPIYLTNKLQQALSWFFEKLEPTLVFPNLKDVSLGDIQKHSPAHVSTQSADLNNNGVPNVNIHDVSFKSMSNHSTTLSDTSICSTNLPPSKQAPNFDKSVMDDEVFPPSPSRFSEPSSGKPFGSVFQLSPTHQQDGQFQRIPNTPSVNDTNANREFSDIFRTSPHSVILDNNTASTVPIRSSSNEEIDPNDVLAQARLSLEALLKQSYEISFQNHE
jgi:hypothetical protein